MSTFEQSATDLELDQFWGKEITEIDRDFAIGKASTQIDEHIYSDIAYQHFEKIACNIDNAEAIGQIIIAARKQWIADRASRALYGKAGFIKPNEVNV